MADTTTRTNEPFANIDELRDFIGDTDFDSNRAANLLEFASNYLRQIATNNNVKLEEKYSSDTVYRSSVKFVVLSAVKRSISTNMDLPPASGYSMSATPYFQSATGIINPDDSLYFKNNELRILGLKSINGKTNFGILRGAL